MVVVPCQYIVIVKPVARLPRLADEHWILGIHFAHVKPGALGDRVQVGGEQMPLCLHKVLLASTRVCGGLPLPLGFIECGIARKEVQGSTRITGVLWALEQQHGFDNAMHEQTLEAVSSIPLFGVRPV
jgi:hypothetical protein